MRPIVIFIFFLIFAAATMVWVLNDPQMKSWQEGPILSTFAKLGGIAPSAEQPAPAVPVAIKEKAVDPTAKLISALTERLNSLEADIKLQNAKIVAQQSLLATNRATITDLQKLPTFRVENGFILAKKGEADWKLTNLFSKKRIFTQRVDFTTPFTTPPKIHLGILNLELITPQTRLRTIATNVDITGFTLEMESKSEEKIGEISVSWAAFGE